jgi:hypothetical protein
LRTVTGVAVGAGSLIETAIPVSPAFASREQGDGFRVAHDEPRNVAEQGPLFVRIDQTWERPALPSSAVSRKAAGWSKPPLGTARALARDGPHHDFPLHRGCPQVRRSTIL